MKHIEELIELWSKDEYRQNRIERLEEAVKILEQHLEQFGKVTKTKAYNFIMSQIEHYRFLIKYFKDKDQD